MNIKLSTMLIVLLLASQMHAMERPGAGNEQETVTWIDRLGEHETWYLRLEDSIKQVLSALREKTTFEKEKAAELMQLQRDFLVRERASLSREISSSIQLIEQSGLDQATKEHLISGCNDRLRLVIKLTQSFDEMSNHIDALKNKETQDKQATDHPAARQKAEQERASRTAKLSDAAYDAFKESASRNDWFYKEVFASLKQTICTKAWEKDEDLTICELYLQMQKRHQHESEQRRQQEDAFLKKHYNC